MFKISFYHILERKFYSFEIDALSVSDNFLLIRVVLDLYSTTYKKFPLSQIDSLTVFYFPVV